MCTSFLCPSPRFSLSAFILNQVFLLKTKSLNLAPSSTTALFFLDKLLKKLNAFHLHLEITFQWLFKQLQCGCHRRFFTTHQLSRKSPKTLSPNLMGVFKLKVLNLPDLWAAFITAGHSLKTLFPFASVYYTLISHPLATSLPHPPLLTSPPLNLRVQESLTLGSVLTLYSPWVTSPVLTASNSISVPGTARKNSSPDLCYPNPHTKLLIQ